MKRNLVCVSFLIAKGVLAQTVETIPYRAMLSSDNEIPSIAGLNASGAATIWVHLVRDAGGRVTSGSIDFNVSYKFPAAVTLTAMHIHKAPAGVNGDVVIGVPFTRTDDATGSSASPLPPKQVQFSSADTSKTIFDSVNGLLADPSGYYFNIHSTTFPNGVIRGQLQRAEMAVVMGLMSPANEVPAIQGLEASAVASVVLLRTIDARGNITSGYAIFDVNYNGFPADTTITGLHIHNGPGGRNADVTISSGMPRMPAAASGSGNLHFEAEANLATAGAIDTLYGVFSHPQDYYINVHTSVNPGGAMRDQLRSTDRMGFQVSMSPANEVPPIADLAASSSAAVTVHTIRNADGAIPAGVVIFDADPRFPADTVFTAMHIHDQVAGQNGTVTIDGRMSAGLVPDSGSGNIFRIVTVSTAAGIATLNDLVVNPEKHYYNIHTTVFPGGAVRAQLAPADATPPSIGSIITAASDRTRTTAAPNALMSIYGGKLAKVGTNLAGFAALGALPRSLNGTSVTAGGIAAPVLMAAQDQVIIQVPAEVMAGTQDVVVKTPNGSSAAFKMPVQNVAPNIFFDAVGGAVLKNKDFSLVRPENPAVAGDILLIYSTGLGQTVQQLGTGVIAPQAPLFNTVPVAVTIGGRDAEVIYSIASPGFAGLYQTAVRMPSGVPPGSAAAQIRVGSVASNTVNIAAQ